MTEEKISVNEDLTSCEINAKDEDGNTKLYYATLLERRDEVKILLEMKADPLIRCSDLSTSLHSACVNGDLSMLKLLTENLKNFDYDVIVNNSNNSLFHSVCYGIKNGNYKGFEIVDWLLKQDANPFIENNRKQTARDILSNFDWYFAEKYDDILEENGCYEESSDDQKDSRNQDSGRKAEDKVTL